MGSHHFATSSQLLGGIFNNAKNTIINGGQFTNVVSHAEAQAKAFGQLQRHVATSAFHDAAQRIDPPRCHENTRKAVMQEIFSWITQDTIRTAWIAWLNGAAGAGKSAIAQSIAEACIVQGILVASFFFFRTDPTRNTIKPLVATLAYQLVRLLPDTKDFIIQSIDLNPLIFNQSLESQLNELIIAPLRLLQLSEQPWKLLFVIDGVDECEGEKNQANLISTFAKLLKERDLPLIVLFCSRAENQIKMAFNSPNVEKILLRLPLDDNYLPDNDIRLFLDDSFHLIHQTHPMSHLLDPAWPVHELVQEIIGKSSGQFIYTSVVVKFISLPRLHPAKQLEIVRGIRPSGSSLPFAQLDALYRHIFSQVQDLQTVTNVLAYSIISLEDDMYHMAQVFGIPVDDIDIAMADLSSVVVCRRPKIRFLHASLPDFLLSQTRSQEYYINLASWSTRLSIMWFKNAAEDRFKGSLLDNSIVPLLDHAEGSDELRETILACDPYKLMPTFPTFQSCSAYLLRVQKLEFGDGGEVYRHQLNAVIRHLRKIHPSYVLMDEFEEHDIEHILRKIDREEVNVGKGETKSWRRRIKGWVS